MAQELTIPVDLAAAREALAARHPSPKRSQIDDTLFRRPDGAFARLRRQDAVTRLSCTVPDLADAAPPETAVLDPAACRRLLELLGFQAVDRVRYVRETWRDCQYALHLDRVEGLGDYLTIQTDQGAYSAKIYRKMALKRLKSLGIVPAEPDLDSQEGVAYTASITRAASAAS